MRDRLTGSCRATLVAWSPPGTEQQHLRRDFLDHLDCGVEAWSRATPGAHLTASALICAPEAGQVLLTLHAKLGRWLQTGGHIETEDDSLEAAALREAAEESGLPELALDPDPLLLSRHEVPCGPVAPCFHLDVQYLVRVGSVRAPTFGPESHDVRWFAIDDLPPTDESVHDLVSAAAHRLQWIT